MPPRHVRALESVVPKLVTAIQPNRILRLGDVVKAGNHKVVAIPIDDEEKVKILKRELMGYKYTKSDDQLCPDGIVLLRIVPKKKVKEDLVPTQEQAGAYVNAIVANASDCEQLYSTGQKLGEGMLRHIMD